MPPDSIGPPLIGALLRMPVDAVRARMLADLHAAGFTDLVPAHFAVLRYPGPQGKRPSQLAAEAGVSRQAMAYLLSELEGLGYLTRVVDDGDARARIIELTQRGERLRRAVRASVRALEHDLKRQLGQDRFAQLIDLLAELNTCEI